MYNELMSALAAAERVFSLLNEDEEPQDCDNAIELQVVEGRIEFDHVTFYYTKGRTVIKDMSFVAEPGQVVAIVGKTGVGKTTIINLLMRFYDVCGGTIRVDGRDIREYSRKSLRQAYTMVLQETWLFQGTIRENIAYGKRDATMEEVIKAAKDAGIHSYIMTLPEGYETIIYEDGGNVSKGQKQLLTIARSMLSNSNMLILDEATSNVDTRTEKRIQKAMLTLMSGRTTFVIAHRLSTIQNADRILVIEQGEIRECGTHKELMDCRGYYYDMYASQYR